MDHSKKRGISDQEIETLNQIVVSLEQAEEKLEQSYKRKKPEQFNAIKKFMSNLNKKMMEII